MMYVCMYIKGLHWWHPPWYRQKDAMHRSAVVEGEGWRLPVEKLPVVPSHPLNGHLRLAKGGDGRE